MRTTADALRQEVEQLAAAREDLQAQNETGARRIKRLMNSVHALTQERDALQRELQETTDLLVGKHLVVTEGARQPSSIDARWVKGGGEEGAASVNANDSYADSSMTIEESPRTSPGSKDGAWVASVSDRANFHVDDSITSDRPE